MLGNFSLKNHGVFILILLVAFFVRIINISNNPPAMYGDELTMVLDVNSILNTGFDTTGKFLPLNFIMGGGRPVGYGYFSIPFVAMFGTTALGIRLLSILSGVGIVFLIYYLGKILFSTRVGLFASAILAISPWDLSMSRGGFETHFALLLALFGIVMFLLAEKKPWFYVISVISFGLSINTYSTYKLTLPLFLPLLLYFTSFKDHLLDKKKRIYLVISSVVLLLFILLLFFQTLLNNSESRFLSLNIFAQDQITSQITQKINEQRSLNPLNLNFSRILNNKFWEYGFLLGKSYLNNFSLDFLFLSGDGNPRHNMTSSGSFYLVEIITIFFGFAYLFKKNYLKKIKFLIGWLLISPVATSLLLQTHALRSSFMLPSLILLSAVGLNYLWVLSKRISIKVIIFVVMAGFLIQFIFIMENLYFISPNKFSRFWAYPAKKAAEIAMQNKEKYKFIFLSDRIDSIEFAYPAYAKISPSDILGQNQHQVQVGDYKFRKYGNIYIGPIPDSSVQEFLGGLKGAVLYVGPETDQKDFSGEYQSVNGLDNQKALVVKKIGRH